MRPGNNGAENLRELTAYIVSAYLSSNQVGPGGTPTVINTVHSALREAGFGAQRAPDEEKATAQCRAGRRTSLAKRASRTRG
jgi:predicted transcriptional regulator